MRLVRTLVACSLVACAVALSAPPPASASSLAGRVIAYVNQVRKERGRRPLRASPSLARSSSRYARWMLRNDYFGHRGAIAASGRFRRLGEALAMQWGWRPSWRWAVRAWMRSATHRRILLSGSFSRIGVGMALGRMGRRRATTWVVHVGGG